MRRARYEVRPEGGKFVVWDTHREKAAVNGWRFQHEQHAKDAAAGLNAESRQRLGIDR